MSATDMLAGLRTPQTSGLVLRLTTRTPLYTGGVGQLGDQVHPSSLLGGIRHFSCLVARMLGDADFEHAVWGNSGGGSQKAQAKQVALYWDTSGLTRVSLPETVRVAKASGGESRWFFNSAFEGELELQLARRGISDAHWHILTLALSAQIRHATFGAKDQFGLGVLAVVDGARPFATAWDLGRETDKPVPVTIGRLSLLRYAFGRLRFRVAPGQRPNLNRSTALHLALATRATLRNALRARPDAPDDEKARLTTLRHQMLGKLNQSGSAVNVSAAYAVAEGIELRLAVALKPEDAAERSELMNAFANATSSIDGLIDRLGYRVDGRIVWEFGGRHAKARAAWLNKLAGV